MTDENIQFFVNTYLKMFFLLAPFFTMSMFLKMAEDLEPKLQQRAAIRTSITIMVAITVFFFFGRGMFNLLRITLPAFQIGAGSTLFLSSVMLVLGIGKPMQQHDRDNDDFSVVPLALPIIVGPGTIGTLMVWGTEIEDFENRVVAYAAIFCGGLTMTVFLLLAEKIQKLLGQRILSMLTKITALVLTALASQIIFSGIKSFMEN
jgi:multiple antibiotic resistance protein